MAWRVLESLFIGLIVVSCAEASAKTMMSPAIVPDIVHQTYDYASPNFFLFLSLLCVQRFMKPQHHYLWVMDEGRFRKGQWDGWQYNAKPGSWESEMVHFLHNKSIEWHYLTFPLYPPNKPELQATNKAHRSDFARMKLLLEQGGVYLDTDAYVLRPLHELYQHEFTIAFDNIVNLDETKPKRMNNGVLLAAPNSSFLQLWQQEYQRFNPASFDHDSSVVPYRLATLYPDLIHVEQSRLSPISYGFQTSLLAEAITCGIFIPPGLSGSAANPVYSSLQMAFADDTQIISKTSATTATGFIWYAQYDHDAKHFTFERTQAQDASYMFKVISRKMVLHLTMSQVR